MKDFEKGARIVGSDWPANRLLAHALPLMDFSRVPMMPRDIVVADRHGRAQPTAKRIKFRRPRVFD